MGNDGIYAVWIAMRRYPWLPPVDYRDKGESAAHVMRSVSDLVVIKDGVTTVKELLAIIKKHEYHGYPVTDKHGEYVGYTTRDALQLAVGEWYSGSLILAFFLPCFVALSLVYPASESCSESRLIIIIAPPLAQMKYISPRARTG